MSFTMKTLTEGIRQRHMGAQHQRLTEKWNRTGLLRGLNGYSRENMAVMLENQAAQLLRETNTLGGTGAQAGMGGASGDIRGFQNVAFPIVRRVFGGLVANELVSIQPMSLPSGLLFYLDYTYGNDQGGVDDGNQVPGTDISSTYESGQSIYNNPVGKGVQSGSIAQGGQYDLLGSGYSRVHGLSGDLLSSITLADASVIASTSKLTGDTNMICLAIDATTGIATAGGSVAAATELTGAIGRLLDFDVDVQAGINDGRINGITFIAVPIYSADWSTSPSWNLKDDTSSAMVADLTMIQDLALVAANNGTDLSAAHIEVVPASMQAGTNLYNFRRHNKLVRFGANVEVIADPLNASHVLFACPAFGTTITTGAAEARVSFVATSNLDVGTNGDALTVPVFESTFAGLAGSTAPVIPEIDIKIESLAVTAVTRKLKAKWSPELAQDLNAYHSLDAEVELTQILSEQIALEIDREVLNDLLTQANGASLYWSRAPGKFVNKVTGIEVPRNTSLRPGPQFTGTVRDWYETLTETVIDCANTIHRKTLRGSANFMVIGPDVATILEASVMYKPSYSLDGEGQASAMSIGAEKIGTLSNRFTVYKDPYFPRNKILVGYKGGSYLETGYVYAPYVPLIVTPTIFAPEDFTPRKGVMTRYGKKMVRSDFYGTVTCMDMNII
jgi:hypothetical protein